VSDISYSVISECGNSEFIRYSLLSMKCSKSLVRIRFIVWMWS